MDNLEDNDNHRHDCNESENIFSYFKCSGSASCTALVPTKYEADKRIVTNMRGRWLQVPGDISGYIQDRVMGLEDPFSLTGYCKDVISAGRYEVTGVSWGILQ